MDLDWLMKWRPDERKFFQGPWQPTRGSRWGPHWGGRGHRPKCLRKVPLLGPWRVWVGWQTKSRWPHTSDIWSTSSSWRKRWRFSLGGTPLGSPQRTSTRLCPTTCPHGLCPGTTWTPKTKPWRVTSRNSSSMTGSFFVRFQKTQGWPEKTQARIWARNSRFWSQLKILSKNSRENLTFRGSFLQG